MRLLSRVWIKPWRTSSSAKVPAESPDREIIQFSCRFMLSWSGKFWVKTSINTISFIISVLNIHITHSWKLYIARKIETFSIVMLWVAVSFLQGDWDWNLSIEGSQRKHKFIVNAMVYAFFSGMSNSFKRKKMLKKQASKLALKGLLRFISREKNLRFRGMWEARRKIIQF